MKYLNLLGLPLAAALGACSVGPVYRAPAPEAPAAFGAPLPPVSGAPAATGPALAQWWTQFDDPVVAVLVNAADTDSPTLARAAARIAAARALVGVSAANRWPQVDVNLGATRVRTIDNPYSSTLARTTNRSLDASWEIDLFGGLAQNQRAAAARLEARSADWYGARVSLAAEVALTLVRYRACGQIAEVLDDEVRAHRQSMELTALKIKAGLTSPADGALTEAAGADARQQLAAQRAECSLDLAALVELTGIPDSTLRSRLAQGNALPAPRVLVVTGVPAQVLAQRPDIAAAERELAAANADINVAQARLYPRVGLLGSIGVAGLRLDGQSGSQDTWSFGPALSLPLFNRAGLAAGVAGARAGYDERLALYRTQVRAAIREVEEALVRLDAAARREDDARVAALGYERFVAASAEQYRAGSGSLLDLEQARRSARVARQTLIGVRKERVSAWIALYKALGGGWQPATGTALADNSHPVS